MKVDRPDLQQLLVEASPSLFHRFQQIEQKIRDDILPLATPPSYTDHGVKHAHNVQENLKRLLPAQLPEPLSGFELFALLLSTMLHDVGMVLTKSSTEAVPAIRLDHYERSREFVIDRHAELELTRHEALIVGTICQAHGMPTLDYLQGKPFSLRGAPLRVSLLSALLRIADYLDLTAERAPAIFALSRIIPTDSQRHWDLHDCISSVDIVSDPSWDITIVSVPSTTTIEARLYDLRNSVQAELDVIAPVLRAAGIYFKRIDLVLNSTLLDQARRQRKNPFLRLAPFGPRDSELFAGRDDEVNQLIEHITGRRLVVLIGESGVGKTSLVEAGVIPRLRGYDYDVVRFSFHTDPLSSLVSALDGPAAVRDEPSTKKRVRAEQAPRVDLLRTIRGGLGTRRRRPHRLLIIGDHLEQMFTTSIAADVKTAFVRQMARTVGNTDGRVTFLFCIRQDYLSDLYDLSQELPELYDRANTFKLQRLTKEHAVQALTRASRYARLELSQSVVQRIVGDLADEGEGMIYPPFLQIVGYSLYASAGRASLADGGTVPEALYDRLGRAESIVNRYLDGLLDDFSRDDRPHVGEILHAMVTEYHTKRRVTRDYLQERIPGCRNLDELLGKLVQDRIVRRSLGEYELIHDFLAKRVLRLIEKNVFISPTVRRALEFIDAQFARPGVTSGEIAKAAGVTATHLARLFKQQLGVSVNAKMNSRRIAAAKRMIAKSREPMGMVARSVGFRSLGSFSRKFAQVERLSPLAYRATTRHTRVDAN